MCQTERKAGCDFGWHNHVYCIWRLYVITLHDAVNPSITYGLRFYINLESALYICFNTLSRTSDRTESRLQQPCLQHERGYCYCTYNSSVLLKAPKWSPWWFVPRIMIQPLAVMLDYCPWHFTKDLKIVTSLWWGMCWPSLTCINRIIVLFQHRWRHRNWSIPRDRLSAREWRSCRPFIRLHVHRLHMLLTIWPQSQFREAKLRERRDATNDGAEGGRRAQGSERSAIQATWFVTIDDVIINLVRVPVC